MKTKTFKEFVAREKLEIRHRMITESIGSEKIWEIMCKDLDKLADEFLAKEDS